jgi:hypothetical protein
MTLKRTTLGFVAIAALAAWFASAMTPGRPPLAPVVIAPAPIDATGEALASEIARLRERLRPEPAPREPTRNPFAFGSRRRTAPAFPAPEPSTPTPFVAAAAPSDLGQAALGLSLSGIAEDAGTDGPARTAIIAGGAQLILARTGDTISDGGVEYTVESIAPDSVSLRAVGDGTIHRLSLK